MKEKISMVKLTEKQEQAVKGGVVYSICDYYGPIGLEIPPKEPPTGWCVCYIMNGHCATQLWPAYPKYCEIEA